MFAGPEEEMKSLIVHCYIIRSGISYSFLNAVCGSPAVKGTIPWCLLCLCLNSELLGSASRPIVLLLEQINPTLVNEFCIAIASVATCEICPSIYS